MKPMCGPLLGLVIALRALPGEPTLVSTSSTVPFGSSRASTAPIRLTFFAASSSDVPGARRT